MEGGTERWREKGRDRRLGAQKDGGWEGREGGTKGWRDGGMEGQREG